MSEATNCPDPLAGPQLDPTPIFEHFRGSYGSELLTAAVAHFGVFRVLQEQPQSQDALAKTLGLADRPATVLLTALRAMGLIATQPDGCLALTDMAQEHLVPGGAFDVGDYIGLAATSPGVLAMVERLRTDQPANMDGAGAAFIYRDGMKSAMEEAELARHFTLALAGRAKNVAPILAQQVSFAEGGHVLDVGGGTGIYSIAFLRRYPTLRATLVDLPHVLAVAADFAKRYGVEDRLDLVDADMFHYRGAASVDTILLSNILHDWGGETCQALIRHYAEQLPSSGRLMIHDVFLNDAHDGPLAIALYSAALFTLTEGRAYSAAEYTDWLQAVGLTVAPVKETLIHCGVLVGTRS